MQEIYDYAKENQKRHYSFVTSKVYIYITLSKSRVWDNTGFVVVVVAKEKADKKLITFFFLFFFANLVTFSTQSYMKLH